jgi:hypothetical protein
LDKGDQSTDGEGDFVKPELFWTWEAVFVEREGGKEALLVTTSIARQALPTSEEIEQAVARTTLAVSGIGLATWKKPAWDLAGFCKVAPAVDGSTVLWLDWAHYMLRSPDPAGSHGVWLAAHQKLDLLVFDVRRGEGENGPRSSSCLRITRAEATLPAADSEALMTISGGAIRVTPKSTELATRLVERFDPLPTDGVPVLFARPWWYGSKRAVKQEVNNVKNLRGTLDVRMERFAADPVGEILRRTPV